MAPRVGGEEWLAKGLNQSSGSWSREEDKSSRQEIFVRLKSGEGKKLGTLASHMRGWQPQRTYIYNLCDYKF